MHKIPSPSSQAAILTSVLADKFNLRLPRQQALDLAARLNGHKTWNHLVGHKWGVSSGAKPSEPSAQPASEQAPPSETDEGRKIGLLLEAIGNAAQALGHYNGEVPLTGPMALLLLSDIAASQATQSQPAEPQAEPAASDSLSVSGFGIDDVLTVRPDLTREEAAAVLRHCQHNFDACVGLNWDVLEAQSYRVFAARAAFGAVVCEGEKLGDCTLSLATGTIYVVPPSKLWELNATEGALRRHELLLRSTLSVSRMRKPLGQGAVFRMHGQDTTIEVPIDDSFLACGGDTDELRRFRLLMTPGHVQPLLLPLGLPR